MPESSLNDDYVYIVGGIGDFLGFGAGEANGEPAWTPEQESRIKRYLKSGLRSFYYPPPVDGVQYEWSFLKPLAALTLPAGQQRIEMPDDFGGLESTISMIESTSSVRAPWPIRLAPLQMLLQDYAILPTTSGRPIHAALEPIKGTNTRRSNRYELWFFPIPDSAYTVQFQYYLLAEYISGSHPYAYGGAGHAETILEACLAQAELKGDDIVAGPHAQMFKERLAASIALDRRSKAHWLGQNLDRSDGMEAGWSRHGLQVAGITYNGSAL